MAISPPNYQKDAIPTSRGWTHPRTGELLVSRPFSQAEINEYMNVEPEIQMIKESPTTMEETVNEYSNTIQYDLDTMSKKQLEELGRTRGIELDRRKNKADLIEELKEVL